jgi:membrane-anchored protein YejM (alkaline phosphatase superfamily)
MGKILIVLLAIALVVLFPLAAIWSVNMLFPVLAIPVSFDTWVAVVVLGMFFRGDAALKFKA